MYYWKELIELWYSNKWFYKYLSRVNFPLWEMQSSWGWSCDLFLESSKVSPALRRGCSIYRGVGRGVQAAITDLQWVLRVQDKSQLLNTHWCVHKEDKCACQAETGALHSHFLLDRIIHRTCKWNTQGSVISCSLWVAGGWQDKCPQPRGTLGRFSVAASVSFLCFCAALCSHVSARAPCLHTQSLSEILVLFNY